MSIVDVSEWYALNIYPFFYRVLSRFSSLFPFSVGDCFIYGSIAGLLAYLVYAIVKRKNFGRRIGRIIECLAWVYVWFYLAWGLNYYRHDFYARSRILPATFSDSAFRSFLDEYTEALNASWYPVEVIDPAIVEVEIKDKFKTLPRKIGLAQPTDYLRVKPMLSSTLMSKVGVKGYMGPFFSEFNLNRNLPPSMYPFTYTHEMAHVLGIANEAEANLYGYQICIASDIPEIRFSGYQALFPYVWSNARRVLSPTDFEEWKASLNPEFVAFYNKNVSYLHSLYDPKIGEIQDYLYNLFLKGNRISSGTANYSEVIALLIAIREDNQQRK